MNKKVLIIAGETSGDIHAANLVKNLKSINPLFHFFGIGGPRMESAGVEIIERMENISVVGIWEVLAHLKDIHTAYAKVIKRISESPPDVVILIDYPGFNLTLAKAVKKKHIPIIYYITPQVWAWGKSRLHTIKRCIDKAIVILKFEEALFKKHGIDATFVGHPLLDREPKAMTENLKSLGLDEGKMTVALLPGSRNTEVKKMFLIMLKTAQLIKNKKDVQFILLKSSNVKEALYDEATKRCPLKIAVIKDDTHTCLSLSDFALTSSGTATLESAIMEKPMVITYRTSFLTALLFRLFADIRNIGLVNIIAGKEVSPELLQYDATPENLSRMVLSIITSPEKLEKQTRELKKVKESLGTSGASERAAKIISNFLNK